MFSSAKQQDQFPEETSSNADNFKIISAEKSTDRNLTISLASLGIATIGTWFYPPLVLVSAATLLYV